MNDDDDDDEPASAATLKPLAFAKSSGRPIAAR
jgi:hypothetical protein